MDERIRHLLSQMSALESELKTALHQREARLFYHIKGKRVEFERTVRDAHRQLKMGIFRWFASSRPQNYFTAPFIYGLIVPFVFLDLGVTIYQTICFPIYRIAKVKRSDYIVLDRHRLAYLNWIEKFHCEYCSYANGLIAYVAEVAARTEQYWCPIKHARKVLGTHARYAHFIAYGDATDYQARLDEFRGALEKDAPLAAPEQARPPRRKRRLSRS
jgi:hypothetical protein